MQPNINGFPCLDFQSRLDMATVLKDAQLKREVVEVLANCRLDDAIIDREVQINYTGEKDNQGNLLTEKEIDVIVKFAYGGKKILLFFECENSQSATGVKKNYRDYEADVKTLQQHLTDVQVIRSQDNSLKSRHFRDIDLIRVCFVYGSNFPETSYQTCLKEARPYSFLVWNYFALTYYRRMSPVLSKWMRYELFKDFSLKLEGTGTFRISALEIKQKGKLMYLGRIHPGQLLKIAYVVRRASEKTYAYQRLLSRERISAIGEFISSDDPQAFLPNTVLAVFDPEVRATVRYDRATQQLTVPLAYCSAWMIDGQHRAYGFLGTPFEEWTPEKFEPFDLPVIFFPELPDTTQTQTFININYFQKRIKSELLCDLSALTKDLRHKLAWPSLIGQELNRMSRSVLRNKIKISELHSGRPISLASFAQYGLLETLLGYKPAGTYSGPLYGYAHFNRTESFDSTGNQAAFRKQVNLLDRFFLAVHENTHTNDSNTDPWRNTHQYALLRPTGINALFMLLAKILVMSPRAEVDFGSLLRPLNGTSFKRDYVAKMGGGWKGFRAFANVMIRRINKGKARSRRLNRYGEKEKI